jgi:hypothetical protein
MDIQWGFRKFCFLKGQQSLTLRYNLYIYDNLGKYTQLHKVITIVGKNEPPELVYIAPQMSGGEHMI